MMAEPLVLSLLVADLLRLAIFLFTFNTGEDFISYQSSFTEDVLADDSVSSSTNLFITPLEEIYGGHNSMTFGCPLLNQRYYVVDEQCYELMSQGPCPKNQRFYQDPEFNDQGICDCESILLIYSAQTDECYEQNSQGPCQDGEWFTLNDEGMSPTTPSCQPIPDGCLADGKHVYWSPDDEGSTGMKDKQCWVLGSQGPCSHDEILDRYVTNYIGCQSNNHKFYKQIGNVIDGDPEDEEMDSRSLAIGQYRSCAPGSRRSQTGKCRVAF